MGTHNKPTPPPRPAPEPSPDGDDPTLRNPAPGTRKKPK